MTKEIVVATDSAASFKPGEAEDLGIAVMPLHLVWPDGTQTLDNSMEPKKFYQRMAKEGIPSTSGANYAEFMAFYRELIDNGAVEILSIHLTEKKSVILTAAQTAALEMMNEYPDIKIRTVDSKALSVAQMYVVEQAAKMVRAGMSLQAAEKTARNASNEVGLEVALGNLENVIKGGRIKGAQAIAAAALGILPIVSLSDGDLTVSERVMGSPKRTRRKMVDRVARQIDERGRPERIGIIFTYNQEIGEEVKDLLLQKLGQDSSIEDPREAGVILGVHAGPEATAVGLKWRSDPDKNK